VAACQHGANRLIGTAFEKWHFAGGDFRHAPSVRIEQGNLGTSLGERDAQRQANMPTSAHDRNGL